FGSSNGGFTPKGRGLRGKHGAGYAARYYSDLRLLGGGWGTYCYPVIAPLSSCRNSPLCRGAHHARGVPLLRLSGVLLWRLCGTTLHPECFGSAGLLLPNCPRRNPT